MHFAKPILRLAVANIIGEGISKVSLKTKVGGGASKKPLEKLALEHRSWDLEGDGTGIIGEKWTRF